MRFSVLSLSWILLLILSVPANALKKADVKACVGHLKDALQPAEAFLLFSGNKLYRYGHLPEAKMATYRRAAFEEPSAEGFAAILKNYGITPEEWRLVEKIEFEKGILGTKALLDSIDLALKEGTITKAQQKVLKKINDAAEDARENLKRLLFAAELEAFDSDRRLRTFEELRGLVQRLAQNTEHRLSYLGFADLAQWRKVLLTENEKLRKKIEKVLMDTLHEVVEQNNEIVESNDEILTLMAQKLKTEGQTLEETIKELKQYFGEGGVFRDVNHLIDATRQKHPGTFKKVIDRRFFTEEYTQRMLQALRNADEIITLKLAENQDLGDFEAVLALSKGLNNAPILVSPPFGEIGLIPEKLGWLFQVENVFLMVDRGIQLLRDFYIVDHGFEDKRQNPFVGLGEVYEPTDRVVTFHPRVRALTRATGNYPTHPGYFITTGSMSDPAYWGKFNISMSTDERAQLEAEKNRGALVLSRRYRNKKFDWVGGANGIAPRRVRYTDARYGNPAGLFDLGKIYTAEGPVPVKAIPAMVLGDWHWGITDPLFLKANLELFLKLDLIKENPNYGEPLQQQYVEGPVKLGAMVFHDLIDGGPNSRHGLGKLIATVIKDRHGALDLQDHVQSAASALKLVQKMFPNTQFIIPVDNHGHDWLRSRLEEADLFRGPPKDVPLVLKLIIDAITEGANPYERVFQYFGVDTDRVKFLEQTDTYRVGIDLENLDPYSILQGVEVGQHSQMGVKGAKSISYKRLLEAYGANVTGHTHSSAEHGQSVKVGTGTPVKQDYHRGPSNSDASVALVYSDLAIQLLRMEHGSFIPNAESQAPEEFFPNAEFPRLLIRKMPPGGPTTDQFRANPPVQRHRR